MKRASRVSPPPTVLSLLGENPSEQHCIKTFVHFTAFRVFQWTSKRQRDKDKRQLWENTYSIRTISFSFLPPFAFPRTDTKKQSLDSNMPVSRMRMRPWLEKMIESNAIPGLAWVDKEMTMFSIPWKHAARHGWEMDKDACLFKKWAIHTGKYAEGQTCDPKTWKANFRCALNSLPDIEEVKNRSVNKGHQAMRIFKMLPATPKRRKVKSTKKTSAIKIEEDTDYSDTQSPSGDSLSEETTQESTVDSTVRTEQEELLLFPSSDVPTEIVDDGPLSFSNNFYSRFQVSPDHVPDDYLVDDVIEICQQLEKDLHWVSSSNEGMGFPRNEPCTSPGSQWSESSSVDELEEFPQYTTLCSNFINPTDDIWAGFHENRTFMF